MSWLDDAVSVYQLALHCNENSLAETRALLSEVLQRAIEEAARRARNKSCSCGCGDGFEAVRAIEAMLGPEVKR